MSVTDIKNRLTMYGIGCYLLYKTRILNVYSYLKTKYITNIDTIQGVNIRKQEKNRIYGKYNLLCRTLLMFLINKTISYLNFIKKWCDVQCNIIEVSYNYYDKIETILYTCSDINKDIITIDDILEQKECKFIYEPKINIRIFSQFKLNNLEEHLSNVPNKPFNLGEQSNSICLKKYLIKYRDDNGCYEHNLDNILLMNQSLGTFGNAELEIVYFEKGRKKSIILPYHKIKDKHINYFYNSDFTDVLVQD